MTDIFYLYIFIKKILYIENKFNIMHDIVTVYIYFFIKHKYMSIYPSHFYKLGNYDSYGVPLYLDSIKTVSPDTINRIVKLLPEYTNLSNSHPNLLSQTTSRNVLIQSTSPSFKGADVYVTFLYEGAGYCNTIGYYTYPLQGGYTIPTKKIGNNFVPMTKNDVNAIDSNGKSILKKTVIFPNASLPSWNNSNNSNQMAGGGNLLPGSCVRLLFDTSNPKLLFPNNTGIGFFLISNGWNGHVNDGTSVYTDDELNSNGMRQTCLLLDLVNSSNSMGNLIVSFEDIVRNGGDSDFNDVVIGVSYTPVTSYNTQYLNILPPTSSEAVNMFVQDDTGIYHQFTDSTIQSVYSKKKRTVRIVRKITYKSQSYAKQLYDTFKLFKLSNNHQVYINGYTVKLISIIPTSIFQKCVYFIESFINRNVRSLYNNNISAFVDIHNFYIAGKANISEESTKIFVSNAQITSSNNSSNNSNDDDSKDNEDTNSVDSENVLFNTSFVQSKSVFTPSLSGDPYIMTIYGDNIHIPDSISYYKLYANDDIKINAKIGYCPANNNTKYSQLAFLEYLYIFVNNHSLMVDMFKPDSYLTNDYNKKNIETIDNFFTIYKPEKLQQIYKSREKYYKNITRNSKFEVRYIHFTSFSTGNVYIELLYVPHMRDFINSVTIIADMMQDTFAKGLFIRRSYKNNIKTIFD